MSREPSQYADFISDDSDPLSRNLERGYRGGQGYQKSQLGRAQYTRIIPDVGAQPMPVQASQYMQFKFGMIKNHVLAAFRDGTMPYLEFDLTATRDNGSQIGCCTFDPCIIDRVVPSIQGVQVNDMDRCRWIATPLDILDRPAGWLATEGAPMGIDILPSARETSFGSSIDLVKQASRLDTNYSTPITVSGGATGTVSIPTASSQVTALGNRVLKYGVARRFRMPLDLVVSGHLSDPDSLIPYSMDMMLELYLTDPAQSLADVPFKPGQPFGTPIDSGTSQPCSTISLTISNPRLYLSVCNTFGWLRDEISQLVSANRWFFRTTFSKVVTNSYNFPADGTDVSNANINFGVQNFSLKSLQTVFQDPSVIRDTSIGNKFTFPDYGITQWNYRVGNANTLVPAYPAFCGYANGPTVSSNGTNGYSLYNNYRAAKCAQERDYRFASNGTVTPLQYDGTQHISYDPNTGNLTALPGYYSTCVPTISGVSDPSQYRANVIRAFQCAVDLQSASASSEDFASGCAGGQIYLDFVANAMRPIRITNASPGVLTYSQGQINAYLRMRCNAMVLCGLNSCMVVQATSPAVDNAGQTS